MTRIISFIIFFIMLGISILHFSWTFGSSWPAENEIDLMRMVAGVEMDQMYSPTITAIVASLMLGIAIFPLVYTQIIMGFFRRMIGGLMKFGCAGMALVFLGRGLATYTDWWRDTHPTEPFTQLDMAYFGPLCIFLGLCFIALLFDKKRS